MTKIIFLINLLALVAVSSAASADEWEAGKNAFEGGDYASALSQFETARDDGLEGPAVHYNIAVSQFRLGRFTEAGDTFRILGARFPQMHGLAEYNLGLVARRLGDTRNARAHFLRAYELSPDNRTIRVLASRRLREIQPDIRIASRWSGAIGVQAGYDDNIALRDEAGLPVGTTTESPMVDVFASFGGPWNGRSGLRVEGNAYLVKYVDADDFNQTEIRGAGLYEWRPGDWRIQIGVHAALGTLGGDTFDRKVGARARMIRYVSDSASIDLRYTYDEVTDADPLYAGIAGSRQQLDARYRWYRGGHRVQLRYWFETNDRQDPGVSPERIRVGFNYRFQPESGLGYEAGIDSRSSDYDDAVIPRDEDLFSIRAALSYTFRDSWMVMLEFSQSKNDSTNPTYSYDRSRLTLGAMKYF